MMRVVVATVRPLTAASAVCPGVFLLGPPEPRPGLLSLPDFLPSPFDHIINGLADHIQPRDDLVCKRMVVPTFSSFVFDREPQRLCFSFQHEVIMFERLDLLC